MSARAFQRCWQPLWPRCHQPYVSISKRSHEPTPEVFQGTKDHEMIKHFPTCSLGGVHGAM